MDGLLPCYSSAFALRLAIFPDTAFACDLAVVEVKVNERVPLWLTERVASLNMQVVRISKYCQGVEASGLAPRSIFHLPDGGRED